MKKISILLMLLMLSILSSSCISIKIDKKKEKSEEYLEDVTKKLDVSEETFYYVSSESSPNFIENLQPSLISFVQGEESTSIDKIEVENKTGDSVSLNTCHVSETQITRKYIQTFMKSNKDYKGLIIKDIKSRTQFNDLEKKLYAIVLYSNKIDNQIKPYISFLKKLKNEENIPYIFISMDLENLENIPDIWENTIF